jgi:hypothetical protein
MRPRLLKGRESELLQLFEEGHSIVAIAEKMNVSHSTVSLELERLGIRERATNKKVRAHFESIKHTREFSFCLGLLWGNGTVSGPKFIFRHKEKKWCDYVYELLDLKSPPFQMQNDRNHWVVMFGTQHPVYEYLLEIGWKGRTEKERDYPIGDIFHDEFVRAFILLHHYLKKKKDGRLHLEIYGSRNILERINEILRELLGTTLKKVQKHTQSDVCHILNYQSQREIPRILEFLKIGGV